MCEFETHGDINDLKKLEEALLVSIGLGDNNSFKHLDYEAIAAKYGVKELKAQHETKMMEEFGPTVFLEKFPQHTSPFWNMKKDGNYARKIDVILYGIETIGSAERSTNPEEMRHMFNTISDGLYAKTLFSQFGQERVNEELNRFLKLKFFPRCGGGIGLTRMIRAFKLAGSLK